MSAGELIVARDFSREAAVWIENAIASVLAERERAAVALSGGTTPASVYRALATRVPLKDGGYTMDHTSSVYVMDGRGRFLRTIDVKRPPEAVAKDLLALS